ncbi:MAG: RNA polymerase sigma factor RpoD/SigA [Bacteroidales bacterium]|jgi:RNA polymerase primary sigma factor|nr:RNA polymerase sigma factor RpoD/SigA [Bacteroidales bacterium]
MHQLKIGRSITNRESASLDKYLQDIGRELMITPTEEVKLAQRIKEGDEKALMKLVNANLRFVVSVAKQYQNQGLSLSDLISEGNMGLIKAAKRFDETRGFKFISYAVWWIRQAILQALAEQSRSVRLPLNQVGMLNKVKKIIAALEQEKQRNPTIKEIAEKLDMPEDKVADILAIQTRYTSIDAPLTQDEDITLLDVYIAEDAPSTDAELMKESLSIEIERALSNLAEKERDVIKLFFGIGVEHPHTLDEIAARFDLTRERVRQIKEKSIRKLKQSARSLSLKSFLGE